MGRMLGLPDKHGVENHAGPSGGTYEFDQLQNHTFRDLAKAMKFVGVFTIIAGVAYAVFAIFAVRGGGVVAAVAAGVQAAVDLALGGYLLNAAANCMRIVDTQGQDIPNLMAGLEQLRKYFRLQMVLIIIALCLLGAGVMLQIALS